MNDEDVERIERLLEHDPDGVVVAVEIGNSAETVSVGSVESQVKLLGAVVRSIADEVGTDPRHIGFDIINIAYQLGDVSRVTEDLGGDEP